MCGIIGYVGSQTSASDVLIAGLEALEYRGYDSAGIAIIQDKQVQIVKEKGKVCFLKDKLNAMDTLTGTIGIAHTRWATHGEPNVVNAHPHQCNQVTLVHNGIIENYHALKEELLKEGYTFQSETDSEVACAYIDYCYKKTKDVHTALTKAYQRFTGSFAFVIIFNYDQSHVYAMRKNSPLMIGIGDNEIFLASDLSAFMKYTNRYILLEHDEVAVCANQEVTITNLQGDLVNKQILQSDTDVKDIQKQGYEHFMLKEIHEEPTVVQKIIHAFMPNGIEDLIQTMPDLSPYEDIHIVACGSALYAGMIAKNLIEKKARIRVECVCASEYRYANPIFHKQTLVIAISQSGETADTIAALQLAKQANVTTLAIVNVVHATIARMADYVLYTQAGPEISVATTKAYCAQVTILSMIACNLAYIHGHIDKQECDEFIKDSKDIHKMMEALMHKEAYLPIAKKIASHEFAFFIGRGLDYALTMEGSLKLKEISYMHSEAYAAGELKHGTISLIEQGTIVIALATDKEVYEKTISNIKEVKARGAYVILLVSDHLPEVKDAYDDILKIPSVNIFTQTILSVIPLQMLAYHIANIRGCEIDQPRNLAKSVTVE